jgi:hypothetical protein
MNKSQFMLALAVAGIVAQAQAPAPVHADIFVCCNNVNRPIKWSNPTQAFKMTSNWTWGRQPVVDAATRWTDLQGVSFQFVISTDDDANVTSRGDGNEIGWLNENAPVGNPIAVTTTRYDLCTDCRSNGLIEADIRFYGRNNDGTVRTWFTYPTALDNAFGTNGFSLSLVASHELGHAMSLMHTAHGMTRMESHYPSGGWFHDSVLDSRRVTPLADDTADSAFLYPAVGIETADIALINYQDSGVPDPDGNSVGQSVPLSFDPVTADFARFPRNRVARNGDATRRTVFTGDVVDFRLCATNKGARAFNADVPITIRLSTNTEISGVDPATPDNWRFINGTFPPMSVVCTNISFTVPNVAPGSYVVGIQIDTSAQADASVNDNKAILNLRIFKP